MNRRRAISLIVILSLILSGILFINYNMRESRKNINDIYQDKYGVGVSKPANSAFDDQNFYNCVVDTYNKENNASISYTTSLSDVQLKAIKSLSCSSKNIISTKGISKLSNLIDLDLSNNKLTSLDLSGNILLETLKISNNQILTLDLNKNLNLKTLNARVNNINILVLPKTLSLIDIEVSSNKLRSLNLSFYKKLAVFTASKNNLNAIVLPDSKILKKIYVSENNLTSLDLSPCTNLEEIYANNNNISDLILPNAVVDGKDYLLKILHMEYNNLNNLDISKYTNLTELYINGNNISNIGLSNNKSLEILDVSNNKLTMLHVINNINLYRLYAYQNELTSVKLGETNKKLSNLWYVDVQHNFLNNIDLSNIPNLTQLNVNGNYIKNVDVSNNKKMDQDNINHIYMRIANTYFGDSFLYFHVINNYNRSLSEYNKDKPASERMQSIGYGDKITYNQLQIINEFSFYIDDNFSMIYDINLTELKKLQNLKKLNIPVSGDKKNLNLSALSNLDQFNFSSPYDPAGASSYTYTLNLSNQKWLTDAKLKALLKKGTVRKLILGNNPNLKEIDLSDNKHLMSLTFSSAMTNVTSLNVSNTGLSSLDMTKLPNLTNLNASNSSLESIENLNTTTSLQTLNLTNNRISSLDVSKLTKLETLMVSGQRNLQNEKVLSSLTLPSINAIKDLRIGNNNLSSLDFISKCKKLETLYAYGSNKIDTLNLSSNTKLTTIDIASTSIKQLYLNNISTLTNTMLSNVVKSVPNLISLFLGNNDNLKSISISEHKNLTGIAISDNGNLETISITKNPKFNRITLNNLTNVQKLILNDNNLTTSSLSSSSTSTGLNGLTNLTELDLSNNKISSLNVSRLINLKTLRVSNYNAGYDAVLKTITLPAKTRTGEYLLENLSMGNNLITGKLDLSDYKKLVSLHVYSSKITDIVLPHTGTLKTLSTAGSQIKNLDLSYNPGLTTITINSNVMQFLNLSNISSLNKETLTTIIRSVPNITNLSLGNNQSLTGISLTNSESNSKLEKITVHTSSKEENDNLTWITINNYPSLKTLTLGKLGKLKGLGLSNNSLTAITNLNNLKSITNINLNNNSLRSLNVSNLINLQTLKVNKQRDNNNKIFNSITLPSSDSLYCLEVSDNNLKTINLSNLSGLKQIDLTFNPYNLGTIKIQSGESFDITKALDSIKINSKSSIKKKYTYSYLNNEKIDGTTITLTEPGTYKYEVDFDIYGETGGGVSGTYTVVVSDIDLDIKTDYKISDENKYIYTGLETDKKKILDNIILNSGYEKEIEDNNLVIKKNDLKVREYTIINIVESPSTENNYNKYLSKDYIYTKISEFKSDYVKTNIDNQEGVTKSIANTGNVYEFTISYKGEILKTYKILTIKNNKKDKYEITGKYVYIKGEYEEDTIEVTNGIIEEEDNQLKVKYNNEEIDCIPELKIDFGELNVAGNNIVLKEKITYDEFISNIKLTNLNAEVYKESNQITSGNIGKGMKLKIYSKIMNVEKIYTITDEFINIDKLEVDDERSYISKFEQGTTYQDIQDNITTSGSVKFIDKSGKELQSNDIIRTGSKVKISTESETKEYTIVVYGDVNGDGIIAMSDLVISAKYLLDGTIISEDCYREAMDVIKDGKILMSDIVKLSNILIGGNQ